MEKMMNEIMSMEAYNNLFQTRREAMRVVVNAFKDRVKTLKELHRNAVTDTKKTIDDFVDAVGYQDALDVIATLTYARSEWDGRIYQRNKEWSSEHALYDRDVVIRMGCYADDVIHSYYLNEMASYMKRKEV